MHSHVEWRTYGARFGDANMAVKRWSVELRAVFTFNRLDRRAHLFSQSFACDLDTHGRFLGKDKGIRIPSSPLLTSVSACFIARRKLIDERRRPYKRIHLSLYPNFRMQRPMATSNKKGSRAKNDNTTKNHNSSNGLYKSCPFVQCLRALEQRCHINPR